MDLTRRLANLITRHWLWVLVAWGVLLVAARLVAPPWDQVTEDGDFQYLPTECPSVAGQEVLETRFPNLFARSHMVVIVGRHEPPGSEIDLAAAYDVARRLTLIAGDSFVARAEQATGDERERLARTAFEHYGRALSLTQALYETRPSDAEDAPPWLVPNQPSPIARCLLARSWAMELAGDASQADELRETAVDLDPAIEQVTRPDATSGFPIEKVWTWRTEGIGSALMDLRDSVAIARLIVLHLDSEFLEVRNVELFQRVQGELDEVRAWVKLHSDDPPEIGISGSAAVGSDLLAASAEAVSNTEWTTIVFVTVILALVYRAPLMILVPLITIGVSLDVALRLLALATQVDVWTGWEWWGFAVFKTTRIFVVVILFGAGTDFCLFLIARTRENSAGDRDRRIAIAESLTQVGPAIMASALTTVLGLGMMAFAQFGKLQLSGPAIGIALLVSLAACLTLTPALLVGLSRWLFWPGKLPPEMDEGSSQLPPGLWSRLSGWVVAHPGKWLLGALVVLVPFAWHGWHQQSKVTYDLLAGLDAERPSRQGTDMLRSHFPIGESGPIVILAELPESTQAWGDGRLTPPAFTAAGELAVELEQLPHVQYVRSPEAPLGHRGSATGISQASIKSLDSIHALFAAPPVQNAASGDLGAVIRFDAVLDTDAFSPEATATIDQLLDRLKDKADSADSFWSQARFSVAGTSAAVHDLREVTVADSWRIEWLTVLAVYLVLVVILRHPITCAYMILSVVFSYLVTVGLADLAFSWAYGDNYVGLEWKVPLFLFVILVAVGEDYNVYLASRVFEEQRRHGPLLGLRLAMSRTGGIISSCGAIMAGTFVSMTSPAWHHALPAWLGPLKDWLTPSGGSLQGMIQMGVALTIGVLLDTFVVRPLLLPAYLAMVARFYPRPEHSRPSSSDDVATLEPPA